MTTRHDRLMTWAALLLLAVICVVFVSLGRWQLRRAEERKAIAAQIDSGRKGSPLFLSATLAPSSLKAWLPAIAEGRWMPELSLLIDNRNQEGRPGLWLATPLMLKDGSAVLVLRGWLPRMIDGGNEEQIVTGELAEHVPRLFEIWRLSGPAGQGTLPKGWPQQQAGSHQPSLESLPRVQNIELIDLKTATGLNFISTVLLQTDTKADGLSRSWPQPSIDSDKNQGYALQWFGFATIALIAWVVIAFKAYYRTKRED
eukprot:gene2193-2231_t